MMNFSRNERKKKKSDTIPPACADRSEGQAGMGGPFRAAVLGLPFIYL